MNNTKNHAKNQQGPTPSIVTLTADLKLQKAVAAELKSGDAPQGEELDKIIGENTIIKKDK